MITPQSVLFDSAVCMQLTNKHVGTTEEHRVAGLAKDRCSVLYERHASAHHPVFFFVRRRTKGLLSDLSEVSGFISTAFYLCFSALAFKCRQVHAIHRVPSTQFCGDPDDLRKRIAAVNPTQEICLMEVNIFILCQMYFALTPSLHLLKLIGLGCTA